MKNIVFVVGTRPNFMKVAPLLKEIEENYKDKIQPILIHTGQHYDPNMSEIFFKQLNMPLSPICFNISPGSHAQQTGEIMIKFETYIKTSSKIDLVVVVGDVNSSMAVAIAAAKAFIPIAHVEAGLRSFDWTMPEEINRVLIDSVSTLFFTTEPSGDKNLYSENHKTNVYSVGNVMIDTLIQNLPAANILDTYKYYNLSKNKFILCTLHRPSNVDNQKKLSVIFKIIDKISKLHKIIFLAHPRTQKKAKQFNLSLNNVVFTQPIGYLENLNLMKNAKLVITDSGGIQEETTYLGTPCVTLRKNTERPITVTHGTNIIAGDNENLYEQIILNALNKKYKQSPNIHLWDGHAAARIMRIIYEYFYGGA